MNAAPRIPGDASHVPVLLRSVLEALSPVRGGTFLDGTFGAGGYSRALLEAGAGRVIGIDRDPSALALGAALKEEFGERLILKEGEFRHLDRIAADLGTGALDGVVLDIGVSSMQLDQAARGFSFAQDGPLDMRMSGEGPSAADIVNRAVEADIAEILYGFGEERASRRIARAILAARASAPIERTRQLAEIVTRCLPRPRPGQVHPATRSFQALRIAVNDELGQLVRALGAAERALPPGGRLAVVTFHSLEDRIVKRFLAIASGKAGKGSRHAPEARGPEPRFEAVARAVEAPEDEILINPRARSARLRAAIRTRAAPIEPDPAALGLPAAPTAAELFGRRAK